MNASSQLTEWRPNIFLHEEPISVYGMTVNRRMTVIRLSSGKLWIHSPNTLTAELIENLQELGEVTYLISPNKMHQRALDEFQLAYPDARLYLPSGFPEMRPDLVYHDLLGTTAPPEWSGEIDQAVVRGNVFFTEVVFFHKSSRALLLTDLIENLGPEHATRLSRWALKSFGGYGTPIAAPEHRMYTVNASAFSASVERILQWDFNSIILAHGDILEKEAREQLKRTTQEVAKRAGSRWRITQFLLYILSRLQCLPYQVSTKEPIQKQIMEEGEG